MKVLVTGAAGFIGSHLAVRLVDLGHKVVGIDCFTNYYPVELKELNAKDIEKKGVKILRLDLAVDNLSKAVDGVEMVFHSAAQPGISSKVPFETYVKNNLIATYRLLEAVKDLKSLKGFINFSTSSVYGRHATDNEDAACKPTSYYGVTKLAAEQLVLAYYREFGFPSCSVRPFSIYGPRERPEKLYPRVIKSILSKGEYKFPLYEGSREHIRSYTYIDDLVDGFTIILDNLDKCVGEIFNFGIDSTITTGEGIEIVEDIMGEKAHFDIVAKRFGDQFETKADISKAREMLGYNPATKPKEGLKNEVDWLIKVWNSGIRV